RPSRRQCNGIAGKRICAAAGEAEIQREVRISDGLPRMIPRVLRVRGLVGEGRRFYRSFSDHRKTRPGHAEPLRADCRGLRAARVRHAKAAYAGGNLDTVGKNTEIRGVAPDHPITTTA